jgi:hypothetical protein
VSEHAAPPVLKLGKKPATYSAKDLLMVDFVEAAAPMTQASVGFGVSRVALFKDWGMLGNDQYGDCVWAGSCHEHELWTMLGGDPAEFTEQNALDAYTAVTGFDPNDPNTDQGTDMRNAINYRRTTGITDSTGKIHKIGGFCALEPGNYTQLLQALHIFDSVAIGFEVPASAMDQFNAGKIWSIVPGSPIEGGHYVPCVARPGHLLIDVVTWAKTQGMTQAFYHKYNDETYGIFSEETLVNGKSPEGFMLADFVKALTRFQ